MMSPIDLLTFSINMLLFVNYLYNKEQIHRTITLNNYYAVPIMTTLWKLVLLLTAIKLSLAASQTIKLGMCDNTAATNSQACSKVASEQSKAISNRRVGVLAKFLKKNKD